MPEQNALPLHGKTALITGGARRLGRASALALAAAGADIAITFLRSAREARETAADISRYGVRSFAFHCDVTEERSVREMVRQAGAKLGRIDILVNNAANYETVEFEKLTVRQWDAMFASNTRGPFLVSREALPLMRGRRNSGKRGSAAKLEARIINMGSLGGLQPWVTHAHYCSSKAGLHMLTKVMAKALAPEIAVNAVAPGMIDLGEKAAAAFLRRTAKQTPMRRNGSAEDISAAVLFLASAPLFITGQILAVDGGLSLE
jgi:NAD(P)-dependent dehydrogenase (short-subunit alcohol dehydrogenase family)